MVKACCHAQELEAEAFDRQRKLQQQMHELQAKQQALQGDMGAQVHACVMQLLTVSHSSLPHGCLLGRDSMLIGTDCGILLNGNR